MKMKIYYDLHGAAAIRPQPWAWAFRVTNDELRIASIRDRAYA